MNPLFKLVLVVISSCVLTSCGVMFGGSRYNGHVIVKNHRDAEIYVDGKMIGKGFGDGSFKRNRALVVEVRQPGCPTKTQHFSKAFRGGNFTLSVLSWGLPGLIIDLSTGASFKPEHRLDPTVSRIDIKNFAFTVNYDECPADSEITAKGN
jgi:hypothetical protein